MISAPLRAATGLVLTSLLLASCDSGSSRVRGVPRNLPKIELYGSSQTPTHSMARNDYPFEPGSGNYVTSWASDGRSNSESDYSSWQSSHEGSVSRKQPSPVKKVTSSSTKKKSTASSSKSKSKSGSSSSKGGGSYTIKKGDTLGAIAARNGTTVSKLKAANGMTSDMIREGKSLKIPK
ncbi:MAG: LysM peptidoglycan-binding domain-containing protein [Verrucomicrobiota bacterium]